MSPDTLLAEHPKPRESRTTHVGDMELPRPQVWVVRADSGRFVAHFISGGYAGIGWSMDLSAVESTQELRCRYEEENPEANPHQVGATVSQMESFRQINPGDYVIAPEADTRWLRYGRVTGPCFFSAEDDGCPYRNRRPVDWAAQRLERHRFSESLQNTMGAPKTVFGVSQRDEFLSAIVPLPLSAPPPPSANGDEGGVEAESEDPDSEHIDSPFDPSRIRVRTMSVLVEQLVSRIRHKEIDLSPDFQRLRGIWKPVDKSRLVESLLLRIPIPVFYVAADDEDNWKVVDGVQRISTISDYIEGRFPLQRLEYLDHFDGKRYEELPRPMQRRISETQLTVNVIEPGTPQEVMFNIFHRINTGGLALNGQEIRHALNPGPVREFLRALAESNEFLTATNRRISPKRMGDRECVLRFLAFRMVPWEAYSADSLDTHLGAAMKGLNETSAEHREALAEDFRRAMRVATAIFGQYAFRKRYSIDEEWLRPINKALFESWSVQFARCSQEQTDRLIRHRREVEERSVVLLNDDTEFEKSVSLSTGTTQRIQKRFAAVRDLVQGVLSCSDTSG